MFSDHLKKIDNAPAKTLFLIAGALVIVCQLVAMALVVDGQVAKAKNRDAAFASERLAVIQCMESTMGSARHSCVQQARTASNETNQTLYASQSVPERQALAQVDISPTFSASAAPQMHGFMPASFSPR